MQSVFLHNDHITHVLTCTKDYKIENVMGSFFFFCPRFSNKVTIKRYQSIVILPPGKEIIYGDDGGGEGCGHGCGLWGRQQLAWKVNKMKRQHYF